jgi:pyruvate/2-oxoglutarate dehydrogenase complex dihydrolipoamide acyltransferase (E2) component
LSGWREVPFTANRRVIYDLLQRARRFHAPVSGSGEVDLTDTLARIEADKARGRPVGLIAYLTRATALTVQQHPKLQRHLFTTWYGRPREVAFDRISCTLIIARDGPGGEEILLPLNLHDVDTLSVEQIHAIISEHKRKPVGELSQLRAMERVKRTPGLALSWFSYKARSDPDFYLKYFGTYGLSSLLEVGGSTLAISTVANTAAAFLPTSLAQRPWVVDGQVVPRWILRMTMVLDHHLIDGGEALKIGKTLRGLLEEPDRVLGQPGG